jgi:hypothetical protein
MRVLLSRIRSHTPFRPRFFSCAAASSLSIEVKMVVMPVAASASSLPGSS